MEGFQETRDVNVGWWGLRREVAFRASGLAIAAAAAAAASRE